MEDRHAEAIIRELKRIADLLEDMIDIELGKANKAGLTAYLNPIIRRRSDERIAARAKSEEKRERP